MVPEDVRNLYRHERASVLLFDNADVPDEELKAFSVLWRHGLFHLDKLFQYLK